MKHKAKPSTRFPIIRIGLILILPILTFLWLLLSRPHSACESEALPGTENFILFEVPRNISASKLAKSLKDSCLISHPFVFQIWLRLSGQTRSIKAGVFKAPRGNSVYDMVDILTKGKSVARTLTIPEGKASFEVFALLSKGLSLDSNLFMEKVLSPDFAQELGIPGPTLEGFLFPDTYIFPYQASETEVLRILVKRFRQKTKNMDTASSHVYKKYGKKGWVTLASIVEKEAAVRTEQVQIAGVFYNRLLENWSLGADPTVRYALRKFTGPLYADELDIDSPYNTRKFTGLPPGPICSPGEGALKAALYPANTKNMFFVAKDDGSRQHFFSTDNDSHNRYKAIAARNRRNRGMSD